MISFFHVRILRDPCESTPLSFYSNASNFQNYEQNAKIIVKKRQSNANKRNVGDIGYDLCIRTSLQNANENYQLLPAVFFYCFKIFPYLVSFFFPFSIKNTTREALARKTFYFFSSRNKVNLIHLCIKVQLAVKIGEF